MHQSHFNVIQILTILLTGSDFCDKMKDLMVDVCIPL